ncbi:hypothetical protein [Vibrio diabolicus]|uniref:hypothetical protein n=1 Tax=Vibrio harveyi group TaxID=717610 RepID=UPI0019400AFC|nr:hypothetical protein [Vibrio parahaemolyticus]
MCSLVDLGLRQGSILQFKSTCSKGSKPFEHASSVIKKGRVGHEQNKGVSENSLFVVLSQDCSIANNSEKFIELAQLKNKTEVQEKNVQHILLGKDYKKLLVKYQGEFYEIEETLLTKVKKKELSSCLQDSLNLASASLPDPQKKILLDWRVLTYFRVPFPDSFNRKLSGYFASSEYRFLNYLKENRDYIHSVRIFVTPEDEESAEHYYFSITVLLYELEDEDDNPSGVPANFQEDLDKELEKMLREFEEFSSYTCIQFNANSIQFPRNFIASLSTTIDDFTFANAETMREFNFQYLCY